MQIIREKIRGNTRFSHYLAYCASFIGYGCVITSLGPAIPYYAAITGLPQTQYSFLFLWRSMGFISGAFSLKVIQKYFKFHTILIFSSTLLLVFLTGFSFSTQRLYQGILIFCVSSVSCWMQIMVNVCVLQTQKDGDLQFWMLICHGVFGIGGLIGPFLVYFFQLRSFIVMGLMIVIIMPFYFKLESPENHALIDKKLKKLTPMEQLAHAGHDGNMPYDEEKTKKGRTIISKQIVNIICFMFLVYIGLEVGFGGWISSFAVLQEVSTKEQATKFTSIFWISITLFRFTTSCIPYKSTKKLQILLYSLIFYCLLTIAMIWQGYISQACFFSSIAFGMSLSSMFPLFLTMPSQYNMEVTSQQNSTFMVWAAMGEGILSMAIGYLMDWFSNNMLFYMILLQGLALIAATSYVKRLYTDQRSDNLIEMQDIIKSSSSLLSKGQKKKKKLDNF